MTGSLIDLMLLLAASTLGIVAARLVMPGRRQTPGDGDVPAGRRRMSVRALAGLATSVGVLSLARLAVAGSPAPAALLTTVGLALAMTTAALAVAVHRRGASTFGVPDDAAPVDAPPASTTTVESTAPVSGSRLAGLLLEGSADAMGVPLPSDPDEFDARLMHANRMQSIGRLAGGIAHDFNNLLTSILTSAELAQDALPAEHGVTPDLLEIRRAGTRASELTRQLLAFSRRDVSHPRVVDLNSLVANLATMLRRVLGETTTLRLTLGNDLPLLSADSARLEQVIVNLAVNARDAMPGGGELQLLTHRGTPSRWSGAEPAPEGVVLEVRDTGVGMSREVRERLFEPYFTTKTLGRGTGLGLPTCRSIVIAHGGEITVDSRPNAGSTFRVWLPGAEEFDPGHSAPRDSAAFRAEGAQPRTILVAEDDADVRTTTVRALRAAGYVVFEAADGEDAVAQLQVHDRPIDLLVADVVMPRMGGAELVRHLRERWPGVQVLYTSGYPGDAPQVAAVESMGEPVLEKPYTSSILLFEVRLRLASAHRA